jgi:isoamylase
VSASRIERGDTFPLGATVQRGGVNFSVYSRNATRLELLLFDSEDAIRPARLIPLNPSEHRTYHYWHCFVPDLAPGQIYGFRAIGPYAPERGLRFDVKKSAAGPVRARCSDPGRIPPR